MVVFFISSTNGNWRKNAELFSSGQHKLGRKQLHCVYGVRVALHVLTEAAPSTKHSSIWMCACSQQSVWNHTKNRSYLWVRLRASPLSVCTSINKWIGPDLTGFSVDFPGRNVCEVCEVLHWTHLLFRSTTKFLNNFIFLVMMCCTPPKFHGMQILDYFPIVLFFIVNVVPFLTPFILAMKPAWPYLTPSTRYKLKSSTCNNIIKEIKSESCVRCAAAAFVCRKSKAEAQRRGRKIAGTTSNSTRQTGATTMSWWIQEKRGSYCCALQVVNDSAPRRAGSARW